MSEHGFWVRPKRLPPLVAPHRNPVAFYTVNQVYLSETETRDYKKAVENELEEKNPDLFNRRAACLLVAKNADFLSETSIFLPLLIAIPIVLYQLGKLGYYSIIIKDDVSVLQIIAYMFKTSPLTYAFILLFIIISCVLNILFSINREDAQKKAKLVQKEVSDLIDSEYVRAYSELIAQKTSRINAELGTKEFIQAEAERTLAENVHRQLCERVTQECYNLCKEAVSIYNQYANKLAKITNVLQRLAASITEVETTFKENQYAPFWKAVEDCFDILTECDAEFKKFRGIHVDRYYEIRNDTRTENNFLHLPVPVFDIQAPQKVLIRLNALIRKSESVIEFATIHQMIETRREIVEGFQNLHEAVERIGLNISETITSTSHYLAYELAALGRNIEYSLEAASEKISSSVIDVNEANIEAIERLNDSVTEASNEMLELAERSESAREEEYEQWQIETEKQIDALDDIRRGRIPKGPNPRKRLTRPR